MDLGLHGKHAIVCAASKGLGRACAQSLAREGVALVICARGDEALQSTANELRALYGVTVNAIACDITTPEGRAAVLAACPTPDILVTNAGGPPLADFRKLDQADWHRALNANMLTPIELIKATLDGMIARRFGRIINITSGQVKAPMPNFDLSNGARSGLTGFIAGLARQVVKDNVTINNLLPGFFMTDRVSNMLHNTAASRGISVDDAKAERLRTIPAGRLGDATELGDACAYLCSTQAGYITGLNLLLDGGAYPGTF
jgi:3-oxoacyl-[acyl-carrier protein] reductase